MPKVGRPTKAPEERIVYLKNVGIKGFQYEWLQEQAKKNNRNESDQLRMFFSVLMNSDLTPQKIDKMEEKLLKSTTSKQIVKDLVKFFRRTEIVGKGRLRARDDEIIKFIKNEVCDKTGLPYDAAAKLWVEVWNEVHEQKHDMRRKENQPIVPDAAQVEAIKAYMDNTKIVKVDERPTFQHVGDPEQERYIEADKIDSEMLELQRQEQND